MIVICSKIFIIMAVMTIKPMETIVIMKIMFLMILNRTHFDSYHYYYIDYFNRNESIGKWNIMLKINNKGEMKYNESKQIKPSMIWSHCPVRDSTSPCCLYQHSSTYPTYCNPIKVKLNTQSFSVIRSQRHHIGMHS